MPLLQFITWHTIRFYRLIFILTSDTQLSQIGTSGFFATFLPAIMLMKESRAAFAAHLSKSCVKSCHHSEHFLQHIAIYAFMRFDVLCPALKCLFAERLTVETHIVEVCPSVIDDVKAIGTRLVPCKAHA